ncbi:MAG TPA: glycosyltransferase family 1 protein [Flavobacterium sp.]|nr:glycosyltransferase family 1 protein [Flavobacterium sp.]
MKILLDPQTYNEQKFGGISRYHTEVFLEQQQIPSVEIECPIVFSENWHLKEHGLFLNFRNKLVDSKLLPKFLRKKLVKKFRKQNIRNTKAALAKQDFDVFVSTYYDPYFLENLGEKPFVLTLHDMIHDIFPQYFTRDKYTVARKKLLLEKATRVICVSENTKKDILKFYPHIDASKLDVVYLSQSIDTKSKVNVPLPQKYILFVGNRTIYKNFIFFIKAVAPLLKVDSNLYVVCAGGNGFDNDEKELIQNLGIKGQVIQNNFEDNELASYYSNARCFVFPSEYEGFGIPVLEAMACGCPVVLANHSSFPEVAGDAGVYFELNNPMDLKYKISGLLEDEVLRQGFSHKSIERAAKFSWQKTAQGCLESYRKAIAQKA